MNTGQAMHQHRIIVRIAHDRPKTLHAGVGRHASAFVAPAAGQDADEGDLFALAELLLGPVPFGLPIAEIDDRFNVIIVEDAWRPSLVICPLR